MTGHASNLSTQSGYRGRGSALGLGGQPVYLSELQFPQETFLKDKMESFEKDI